MQRVKAAAEQAYGKFIGFTALRVLPALNALWELTWWRSLDRQRQIIGGEDEPGERRHIEYLLANGLTSPPDAPVSASRANRP